MPLRRPFDDELDYASFSINVPPHGSHDECPRTLLTVHIRLTRLCMHAFARLTLHTWLSVPSPDFPRSPAHTTTEDPHSPLRPCTLLTVWRVHSVCGIPQVPPSEVGYRGSHSAQIPVAVGAQCAAHSSCPLDRGALRALQVGQMRETLLAVANNRSRLRAMQRALWAVRPAFDCAHTVWRRSNA
jgi:hypothetical protein